MYTYTQLCHFSRNYFLTTSRWRPLDQGSSLLIKKINSIQFKRLTKKNCEAWSERIIVHFFFFFLKRPVVGAAFLLVLLGSAFADGDDVDGESCLLLLSIFFCNTLTMPYINEECKSPGRNLHWLFTDLQVLSIATTSNMVCKWEYLY